VSDSTVDDGDCVDSVIDPSDVRESDITGSAITDSNVWYSSATDSNITNSTIDISTILRCNISSSTVNNSHCTDSTINPSDVLDSNITRSTIVDSTVWHSNVTDSIVNNSEIYYSDIRDSNISDSVVNRSTVIESEISANSTVVDSTVINSTIINSSLANVTSTNSTVENSSLWDCTIIDANVTDDVMYSGNITFNGTTWQISAAKNLTDLINYGPNASIWASATSGTDSLTVIFNGTASTDPNIPGDLGDNLSYAWDFTNDGILDNWSNITSYTYGVGTHTVNLTVTDKFGERSTATKQITVGASTPASTPSGGGGGGGGIFRPANVTEEEVESKVVQLSVPLTTGGTLINISLASSRYVSDGKRNYFIHVDAIEGSSATVRVENNRQRTIIMGEGLNVDFQLDGENDMYLRLEQVYGDKIALFVQKLLPPAPVPSGPGPVPLPTPGEQYAPPVVVKEGLEMLDYLIYLVISLIVAGSAVVLATRIGHKSRKKHIKKHIKKSFEDGIHIDDIHQSLLDKGLNSIMAQYAMLEHIIFEQVKKRPLAEVQKILLAKGWDKEIVGRAVLLYHIDDAVEKGKHIDDVKESLIKNGWDEESVGGALIYHYVDKAMTEGYAPDKIKNNLVESGWNEAQLDEEIKKFE
jgi:hypothetical protein